MTWAAGGTRRTRGPADVLARVVVARAQGEAAAPAVDALISTDCPNLTGGIHFIATDRHATYVDGTAYRKQLKRVRRLLGWPELSPGCFDRLRAAGRAEAAA